MFTGPFPPGHPVGAATLMTAVGADVAVSVPTVFRAVTRTRSVLPMSEFRVT